MSSARVIVLRSPRTVSPFPRLGHEAEHLFAGDAAAGATVTLDQLNLDPQGRRTTGGFRSSVREQARGGIGEQSARPEAALDRARRS
jgi:hypothetical protein